MFISFKQADVSQVSKICLVPEIQFPKFWIHLGWARSSDEVEQKNAADHFFIPNFFSQNLFEEEVPVPFWARLSSRVMKPVCLAIDFGPVLFAWTRKKHQHQRLQEDWRWNEPDFSDHESSLSFLYRDKHEPYRNLKPVLKALCVWVKELVFLF